MTAPRKMSVHSASALVAASMIGAGVYTTSGFSLADLGSPTWVLIAWAVGGVIAICGALCYGALAKQFRESGGEYLFLARAVHPAAGMTAGWVSLLAGFTGAIAFAATAFESYLREFDPVRFEAIPANVPAIALVIAAAVIHSIGLKEGTRFQDVAVAAKFVLIGLFLCLALSTVSRWEGLRSEDVAGGPTGWAFVLAFANALTWISLSYSGFNAAVYLSEEIEDTATSVPRAMFRGTVLVTVLYLLLNAVFVFAPSFDAVAGQPNVATVAAVAVARQLGDGSDPPLLSTFVRLVILIGLVTSVSALVQTGPRVYRKMAADGFLPRWITGEASTLDGVSTSGSVPARAIWIQAVLAGVVIGFSTLRQQLDYLGFTLSVCAAMCGSLVFFFRSHDDYRLRVVGYPFVPLIYVGGTLVIAALTAVRSPWQAGVGLATLLLGGAVYFGGRWAGFRPESKTDGFEG